MPTGDVGPAVHDLLFKRGGRWALRLRNSGSPTLNGRGEFVGLVFDMTYDTIASDFLFDTVNTRSIHADARYMLWVMTEVDGAAHLVEEMGVR